MSCNDARPDLVPYHRGELGSAQRLALEDHLESCAACRSELSRLVETSSVVREYVPAVTAPPGMKEGALAFVEAEHLRQVLAAADLHVPPSDLRTKALGGVSQASGAPRFARRFSSRIVAPALAAAAVTALLFALAYRADLGRITEERDRAREIAARAEGQVGPAGHPVQTLALAGTGVSAEIDLYHFRHDNYRVVLSLEEMPVTPAGYHYEVWLRGPSGEVPVGSFRIKSEDRLTNAWVVGVDPVDFPRLVLTVERNDGDPSISSRVLAKTTIDPEHVRHGRYDE